MENEIKRCEECGNIYFEKVIVERTSPESSGWFEALECKECGSKIDVRRLTEEEIRKVRNQLNRQISAIKKQTLTKENQPN